MRSRSLAFIRELAVLVAGLEAALWPLAALGVRNGSFALRDAATVVTAAEVCLALLSLFLTRGDPGSRLRNATASLAVLLALAGGALALLVLARLSAGGGS